MKKFQYYFCEGCKMYKPSPYYECVIKVMNPKNVSFTDNNHAKLKFICLKSYKDIEYPVEIESHWCCLIRGKKIKEKEALALLV